MAVTWPTSKNAPLLQLMDELYDSFPYPYRDNLDHVEKSSIKNDSSLNTHYRFTLSPLLDRRVFGYIDPRLVAVLPWTPDFVVCHRSRSVTLDPRSGTVPGAYSVAIATLLDRARADPDPLFDYLRTGWRDECINLVGARVPIAIERAGSPYLGLIAPGVHLNLLTRTRPVESPDGTASDVRPEFKVWMQRRAMSVVNYPGMLDSTVAGGITAGLRAVDCVVKEAGEEAGLDAGLVREGIRQVGAVTHWFHLVGPDLPLSQPTLCHVFDLCVGPDLRPRGVDGEASGFELLSFGQLKKCLLAGEIKPAAAAVAVDLLIRHGALTAEDDGDYVALCARIKRYLPMVTGNGR